MATISCSDHHFWWLSLVMTMCLSWCLSPVVTMQLMCRDATFSVSPLPLPFNSLLMDLYRHREGPKAPSTEGWRTAIFRTACVKAAAPELLRALPLACGRTQLQNSTVLRTNVYSSLNHYRGVHAEGLQPLQQDYWNSLELDYSIEVRPKQSLVSCRGIADVILWRSIRVLSWYCSGACLQT